MIASPQRQRFEITIQAEGCKFKHVCADLDEDAAIGRVMQSYKSRSPMLVDVRRLGVLPVKLKR
jgi:hypothetical protein